MSANKPRRAGAPAFPKRRPELRLLKSPDERPRPTPDPEMKEILDDMRRAPAFSASGQSETQAAKTRREEGWEK